jgi:hypothetical protein
MAEAEAGRAAIRRALRSLKRRHLAEEGAHSPAIEALTRPFAAHVRPISYSPLPTFPNLAVYSFPFFYRTLKPANECVLLIILLEPTEFNCLYRRDIPFFFENFGL